MTAKKRAVTFDEAEADGLIHGDYLYKDLPTDFFALLEFKVWGKSKNLKLYFQSEDGKSYVLSAFWPKYAPKKMPELDMSSEDIQPGMKFRIKTEKNRRGNTNFLEAHILE